jgi:hypothetical protein
MFRHLRHLRAALCTLLLAAPLCTPLHAAEPASPESAECRSALSDPAPISAPLLARCTGDERVAQSVLGLLQQQRQLPARLNWPEWERELLEKRQIPELIQAVAAMRQRAGFEGATLSERQAGVALFMGRADSAVDVLQSQILDKREVAQAMRWQAALLRGYDPAQAQKVYAQLLADLPDPAKADFALLQQAGDCSLQLGDGAAALTLFKRLHQVAKAKTTDAAGSVNLATSMVAMGDAQRLQKQNTAARDNYVLAQKWWQARQADPLAAQELAVIGRKLAGLAGTGQ